MSTPEEICLHLGIYETMDCYFHSQRMGNNLELDAIESNFTGQENKRHKSVLAPEREGQQCEWR